MQFSKFMPLVCAAAFCAGFISVRADDNPAQAAARAALEEKMRELDAQDASTNAVTPPAIVVAPPDAAQEQPGQPAVVTTAPAPTEIQPATMPAETQPAPVTTSADAQTQPDARAALDQKMRELDAQQASTNTVTLPVITIMPSAAPEQSSEPVKTQPTQTAPVQAPVVATPPSPPPASVNYPGKELGLKPIEAPALPISADKEEQLQALLAKYMADQVSPGEYHMQRAAILAEP
jgi:hypothetical protein